MAGVRAVKARLISLRDNLPAIGEKSVKDVKDELEEAQRQQLLSGSTSTGTSHRKYRSAAYAKKKHGMNPLPGLGNPDLKLTGSFHEKVQAVIEGGKIRLQSTDSKAQKLEADYGKDAIWGLNPINQAEWIEYNLRPVYRKNIIDHIKRS